MTQTAVLSPDGASVTSRTVLVVDDDEMMVALVAQALESQGLHVVTAASGVEAPTQLAALVPDLIVSDVCMPDMDGLTLVSRLRAEPATRSVPLIFLSALAGPDNVLRGLDLGADDYVTKPFQVTELVARVLAKLRRPSVPVDELVRDTRTGLLTGPQLLREAGREVLRAAGTGREGGSR